MHADAQPDIFRAGLLEEQVVAVAGAGAAGRAAAAACAALGAGVAIYDADPDLPDSAPTIAAGSEGREVDPLDEEAVAQAVREIAARQGRLDTLVVDAAALFADTGGDELDPMRAAADAAWLAARSAATEVMIAAPNGGKIVFVAPAPDAGQHAEVARAALENLARTLSIEWARYAIRPTAILPATDSSVDDIGALVAFLASPAGAYYSGCAFSLGGA